MRERLIKIVKESLVKNIDFTHKLAENITDDLIANGVIVPPCKVGDTAYAISESRIVECRCCEIMIHGSEMSVETEHNCDYNCKGCPFNAWVQDYSGEHSCQGEYGTCFFSFDDFGKTVFLTREEAEQALEKMKGETL